MRTICLATSLCLLSLSLLALNTSGAPAATPKVLGDAVEYQIYSEVISSFFSGGSGRKASDHIFVSNHTPAQLGKAKSAAQKSISDRFLIERFGEDLQQQTLDDYEKNRATEVGFRAMFSPELHIVLMPDAELARVASQSSGGMPEGYGEGIVTLSRIGFNAKRTQAIVSLDYFCGIMCATDQLFLLSKSGTTWKVQKMIPILEG